LDDLSDSVEDYREQRYTYPLQVAFEWLQRRYDLTSVRQRVLSNEEILSVLILSGVITHVAKLACHYLIDGLADLQISPDSTTGKYLSSLAENCSHVANSLDGMISEESTLIETMILALCAGERAFEELLNKPAYEMIWTEMRGCFKSIATASN
jgi:hypothetical protein